MRIVASNQLKFGSHRRFNDVLEVNRDFYANVDLSAFESEIRKYRIACFSMDDSVSRIFSKDTLWGYYADKGNGVCLVLDKLEFEKCYQKSPLKISTKKRKVEYVRSCSNAVFANCDTENDVCKFVSKHINDLFFRKSIDWKHEREIRYLLRVLENDSPFIDLGSCIEAAIICVPSVEDYLHSIEYRVLGRLLQNNPIYRYTLQFGAKVLLLNGDRVWAEYDGFDIDM